MNQLGVGASRATREVPENPAEAVAAVVESATALARAELRLAATEARAWLVRAGLGLIALWLSLLLLQVLVLLVALSPIVALRAPWPSVGAMLALALVPAVGGLFFARRELRRLKDLGHANESEQRRSR